MIDDLGFCTLLGSYVGSAILLYLATARPILYSHRISVRTVYFFATGNIIGSILISATTALFQTSVLAMGPFKCDLQHCLPNLNFILFAIISILFLIPILVLSFVLAALYCYKNRMEDVSLENSSSALTSARTRLAWTLFTFTLISLSEAVPGFYMVEIEKGGLLGTCTNFYRADHLVFPTIMNSFQIILWSIALIVDPLSGLLFDPVIRKVWLRHVEDLKFFVTTR